MEDNVLGTMREDAQVKGALEGTIAYGDGQIALRVDPDGGPLTDCLTLARAAASAISAIDARAKHAAAQDLLKVYNESWREYMEADGKGGFVEVSNPAITAEQFMSTIMLASLTIIGDGLVSLGYDDGDLFAGHSIFVKSFDGAAFSDLHVELFG